MSNLAKLLEEHAQLLVIVRRLSEVVAKDSPPPPHEFHALRRELQSKLITHLKAEDWMLYPRLLDSFDPAVAATARKFSEEMGGLAAAFLDYCEKWGVAAIDNDWAGYCGDTVALAAALTNRITRENQELYPLLERLDQAA